MRTSNLHLWGYIDTQTCAQARTCTHAQTCTQARTYHGLHRGRELLFRNGESKHFRYGAYMFQYRLHFLHHKSACPLHPGHTGISCTLNVFPQGSLQERLAVPTQSQNTTEKTKGRESRKNKVRIKTLWMATFPQASMKRHMGTEDHCDPSTLPCLMRISANPRCRSEFAGGPES